MQMACSVVADAAVMPRVGADVAPWGSGVKHKVAKVGVSFDRVIMPRPGCTGRVLQAAR